MASEAKKSYLPRYPGYARLVQAASGKSGSLSVPSDLMAVLTEGLLFKPELTKDGILFRIVDEDKMATTEKAIPAWAKKSTSTKTGKASASTNDSEPDSDPDDEPPTDDDAAPDDPEPDTDADPAF